MTVSETRFGGNAPGLPGLPRPAPVPAAFSRCQAIFGAVEAEPPSTFHLEPSEADLDLAQAAHARRALEAALDHGTALLAALGLPRLVDDGFVAIDPEAAGEALSSALALLDVIDPDPDLEPEDDLLEPVGDDEIDLGWSALHSQVNLGPNTADGDTTALETHGMGFRRSGHDDAEEDDPAGGQQRDEDLPFWSIDFGCMTGGAHV